MDDFEAFYRSHFALVIAIALAHGAAPDHAQDLAQETFYRAWRHFDRVADLEPLAQRAWLIHTAKNLIIDGWRRIRLSSIVEPPEEHRPKTDPSESIALRLDIAQALATLDAVDRQIVILRYMMEMNSREIGEALRMPEATVRSRLQRCRTHLAQWLAAWKPIEDQK